MVEQRSLAFLHRKLSRQWHPTKNGDLIPGDVRPGSHKKVWWICEEGHEWRAAIYHRAINERGCPYCSGRLAAPKTSLKALYPRVARQWHPTKNGELRPHQVTPGSDKKVWWICKEGHEWQTTTASRCGGGAGCPYCSGLFATPETSLSALHPDVASQWHPTKNGELTPRDIRPGSDKKVWWMCEDGHEWQTTIGSRCRRGTGCPYCSGKRATLKTSLEALHPDVASQWHPTKNGELTPGDVRPGSHKKVWWMCEDGHEWQTTIGSRCGNGARCPYCSGLFATPETSLSALHPEVARQWHPTKNGELTPGDVRPGSDKKVWWLCEEGHEWNAAINKRALRGDGCLYCSGKLVTPQTSLRGLYPDLAKQWHPSKNGRLKPEQIAPRSGKKVWWRCNRGSDHEWQQVVQKRTMGTGSCPFCAGRRVSVTNSLAGLFPTIAKQWHPTKNRKAKPSDVLAAAQQRAWWRCPVGHVYAMAIRDRTTRGRGCPACAGL